MMYLVPFHLCTDFFCRRGLFTGSGLGFFGYHERADGGAKFDLYTGSVGGGVPGNERI